MGNDRVIDLHGSPWTRGHRYGAAASDAIRRTVATTYESLRTQGRTDEAIRQKALAFERLLRKEAPDLIEEMEGLAAGATVDVIDVVALNCRYELMWSQEAVASTAIASVLPASDGVLLAQNADVLPQFQPNQVVLFVRSDVAGDIMMIVEAGFIGGFGLNESGIGVCGTVLAAGARGPGLPFRLLLRRALQAGSLHAAGQAIVAAPRAFSAYYLLGSATEGVLGIECTANWSSRLEPSEGLLVHANHFLSSPEEPDEGMARWPDSKVRTARAEQLARARVPLDVEKLQTVLRDHDGFPSSICRHARGPGSLEVLVSLVMDLRTRAAWVQWGPPCRGHYRRHALDRPAQ